MGPAGSLQQLCSSQDISVAGAEGGDLETTEAKSDKTLTCTGTGSLRLLYGVWTAGARVEVG